METLGPQRRLWYRGAQRYRVTKKGEMQNCRNNLSVDDLRQTGNSVKRQDKERSQWLGQ